MQRLGALPLFGRASNPNQLEASKPWVKISRLAEKFVQNETPSTSWPFLQYNANLHNSTPKKVFIHYFTLFPISIDNKPFGQDYYSQNYLLQLGEGGKYSMSGGYIRERPLAVKQRRGLYWREFNLSVEINRAKAIGADGFGLDVLFISDNSRYWRATLDMIEAANFVTEDFRILLEPDADALEHVELTTIADGLASLAKYPSVFRLHDSRLALAPFYPTR